MSSPKRKAGKDNRGVSKVSSENSKRRRQKLRPAFGNPSKHENSPAHAVNPVDFAEARSAEMKALRIQLEVSVYTPHSGHSLCSLHPSSQTLFWTDQKWQWWGRTSFSDFTPAHATKSNEPQCQTVTGAASAGSCARDGGM